MMTEPGGMNCDGFAEVAAELALGVLTGRERARAIAHLDGCEACGEYVRQLAVTGEKVLELLPPSEPSPGFETRVMGQLGISGQRRQQSPARQIARQRRVQGTRRVLRTRWVPAAAAAVAIAVAGGAAGWALHDGASPSSPAASTAGNALRSATLTTASRQAAGKVFLYGGSSPWLYMAVDHGTGDGVVTCQLVTRNGRIITVGSFRLTGGYGHWGSPEPVMPADVVGARLTTAKGTILATATFPATR